MKVARAGLDYLRVVEAAAQLADKDGLEKLSMAALAEQLGVQSPTLYHYVKGLTGLRRALTLYGLEEITLRLGRAIMGQSGDEAVLSLVYTLREYAREHPALYTAIQTAPDQHDTEWLAHGRDVIEIMMRALSAYKLSTEDAQHAIRMIRIIVDGCVTLEKVGGFGLPLEVDETLRRLLVSLLTYLHTGVNIPYQSSP